MTLLLLAALLVLLVVVAVATVYSRNLYGTTILMGIYSLLMALVWTVMLAMDVAFTEASVGAGISTILLFAALVRIGGREREKPRKSLHWPAILAVAATGALLLYGTLDMPYLGDPNANVHRRAAAHYMTEASHHRTHAPNMVTAVLASYRGYDTLFETAVIFTAGMGMILLLRRREGEEQYHPKGDAALSAPSGRLLRASSSSALRLADQDVMRKVSKLLAPFVIVFGIYVITHGELGPGGGFQGGVIVASAFILTALVFGLEHARSLLPRKLSDALPAVGVFIYAGVGLATLLLGGTFLDYDQLNPEHPALGQALGMTLVELGVGLTVATVMVTVFSEMAED